MFGRPTPKGRPNYLSIRNFVHGTPLIAGLLRRFGCSGKTRRWPTSPPYDSSNVGHFLGHLSENSPSFPNPATSLLGLTDRAPAMSTLKSASSHTHSRHCQPYSFCTQEKIPKGRAERQISKKVRTEHEHRTCLEA